MFVNAVFWWWWEFRLRLIPSWTFQLYAFVIGYAFLIYLICVVLVPSDVAAIKSYKEYFMARRRWFFGMLIAWLGVDFLDTWANGSAYFASLGIEYPIAQAALALVAWLACSARANASRSWSYCLSLLINLRESCAFLMSCNKPADRSA